MNKSDNPELIARCYASLVESWRKLARSASRGAVEEGDGYTLISTGSVEAAFNALFLASLPTDLGAVLEQARRFYTRQGVPWCVQAMGTVADALAPQAVHFGLVHADSEPGMILTPLVVGPPPPSELVIRPVTTMQQLIVFGDLIRTVFGAPPDAPRMIDTPAAYQTPHLTLYLGFVKEEPAVTALCSTAHQVATIHAVCTLPAYRQRGFGAAMTWQAVRDSMAEGCTASFLTASPLGHSVYARMGYRECGEVHTWHAPAKTMVGQKAKSVSSQSVQ